MHIKPLVWAPAWGVPLRPREARGAVLESRVLHRRLKTTLTCRASQAPVQGLTVPGPCPAHLVLKIALSVLDTCTEALEEGSAQVPSALHTTHMSR